MKIRFSESFSIKFRKQIAFIAKDKPGAAEKFRSDVLDIIADIPGMPLKNRKSFFYNDDLIRELTFKGYLIIYRIDESKNEIVVFGFMKYVEKP